MFLSYKYSKYMEIHVLRYNLNRDRKVSALQHRDHGFESDTGHDHDSSYDTSTGWFQEADLRVINITCQNLFHNQAKIIFILEGFILFAINSSMTFNQLFSFSFLSMWDRQVLHSLLNQLFLMLLFYSDHVYQFQFNLYLAGTKNDQPLPPVQGQVSLYIRAVWPGSILLDDQP